MDETIIRGLIGKKVFIKTTSGRNYTGKIESVDRDGSPVIFIYLTDKFDKMVILNSKEIEILSEERE